MADLSPAPFNPPSACITTYGDCTNGDACCNPNGCFQQNEYYRQCLPACPREGYWDCSFVTSSPSPSAPPTAPPSTPPAVVPVEPLVASGFVPYYSYTGNLAATGRVGPVVTMGVTQTFSYSLANVDTLCSAGAGSAANSCGIHIHTGTTCTDNAFGHYFTGTVTADPWTVIAYTSLPDGTTSGTAEVTTGALASDIEAAPSSCTGSMQGASLARYCDVLFLRPLRYRPLRRPLRRPPCRPLCRPPRRPPKRRQP